MKYKTFYVKAIAIEHDLPESDVPCQSVSCTECCEKLSPYLTEDEVNSGQYVYTLVNIGGPEPAFSIPRIESGCVYLNHEKKCTIYDKRPLSCRQFDCRKDHHPKIQNKFI